MKLFALGLCAAVVSGACVRGSSGLGNVEVNPVDAGLPDAGPADAGFDAGTPDAGPADAGPADAGPADAGSADAGSDAGTADAGTDGGSDAGTITFGGPGPWPMQNVTYGQNDGIQETPIVGMSTDESQNLWVATRAAVYLRRPGDAKFTRYDVKSGLHLAGNSTTYCDRDYVNDAASRAAGIPDPDLLCPITGAASSTGITEIVGGGPNEVFVGYNGDHNWSDPNDGTWADNLRHTGMLDRVRFTTAANGNVVLQVDRLQMVAGNSAAFWHNRDVMRLVYDHFKHPHDLYVGTNHGIDKMTPDKFLPTPVKQGYPGAEVWPESTYPWMSDHLHPQVCSCGPCDEALGGGEGPLLLGDWRGLAVTASGNLLVGGRWGAGKIIWTGLNGSSDMKSGWFQRGGGAYEWSLGDPYHPNGDGLRPVFPVAREGDVVAISAAAETPDGLSWFASGSYGPQGDTPCASQKQFPGLKNTGDRDLGVASYDHATNTFTYYKPDTDLRLGDSNVRDMVALPDGRLVFASHKSGLLIWNPKTPAKAGIPMNATTGHLVDDAVERMELDLMVSPPVLHVSTNSGATSIRVLP